MIKILFGVLFFLFFASLHYLSYTRVIAKFHLPSKILLTLRALLILNLAGIAIYLSGRYFFALPLWLYYPASVAIGVGFVLFLGTVVYELLGVFRFVPADEERRKFFKQFRDISIVEGGLAYIGAGMVEGGKEPVVKRVDVRQNRFKTPKRIVQISDMHIGGLIDEAFVAKTVRQINELHSDIVVITGDLVDLPIERVMQSVRHLQKIEAPTYYVVGNHEYFHGIEEIIHTLQKLGIDVLQNEHKKIDLHGEAFYIVGVYDYFGYRFGAYEPDINRATRGIKERDKAILLLAHQPRYIEEALPFHPALTLSGHTHGGQLWPFNFLVRLQQPYIKGLHKVGENAHIYVNSGIGFWGPPMRLGSQAEITHIYWS